MRAALLAAALCAGCSAAGTTSTPPPSEPLDGAVTEPPPSPTDPLVVARPYDLHVPSGLTGPAPLVLAFHGYGDGDDGAKLEKFFKLRVVADEHKFLYVAPDGSKDKVGERFWNGTDACCDLFGAKVDDVAYVRALVTDVAKHHQVDPKRVYAVGLSGGAFFVHRLACDAADVFAGVISMSGAGWVFPSKCKPSEGVALVELHGEKDDVVKWRGSENMPSALAAEYPSVEDTIGQWAKHNGCSGALVESGKVDLFTMPGEETKVSRYGTCQRGALELWTIVDGPHAPLMNKGFGAAVWGFFAAHPKP